MFRPDQRRPAEVLALTGGCPRHRCASRGRHIQAGGSERRDSDACLPSGSTRSEQRRPRSGAVGPLPVGLCARWRCFPAPCAVGVTQWPFLAANHHGQSATARPISATSATIRIPAGAYASRQLCLAPVHTLTGPRLIASTMRLPKTASDRAVPPCHGLCCTVRHAAA